MFSHNLKKFAISSVGAIALSATCVLAAVGPARAANAPLSTGDWQQAVSDRVSSNTDLTTARVAPGKVAETILALRFDADGGYAGASVSRSSGNAAIDARALAIADRTSYPALPAGYRGRAQTVTMRLAFGGEQEVARHFAKASAAPRAEAMRIAAR